MPKIIEEMYDERVIIKKKMIASKKELEACDKSNTKEVYRIERDIAHFENQQTAIKILLNSLYGALGNKYFRYFTMEIAEGITITGQFIIKWAEKHVNGFLNKTLKTDKDYVIAIDTDSVYAGLADLVNHVMPDADTTKKVDFLDKVCSKIETDVLDVAFKELKENCNAYKHRITMKREGIANRGIWTAKKRYILNVWDNEGVRYAKPKLKIMGIEAIKSSTPAPCRTAFEGLFQILINGTEAETQKFIQNFRNEFDSLPAEEKAFPRGVSSLKKYIDKKTIYAKGTPINSRAAILYNHRLKELGLENKYEAIKEGEKIKYIHVNPRNPMREDVIGFSQILPPEFGMHKFIDNEIQFEKAFLIPAKSILDAIGWKAEEEASLEDFFG
jgi:DNA polymerase elongation subunit (family B)